LRRRLGFLADLADLAGALLLEHLAAGLVPQAIGACVFIVVLALEFLIEPLAPVLASSTAKDTLEFPIGARFELAYPVLAVNDQRQRWRLHATHGREVETACLRVEGRSSHVCR
jgi:hypothetical protein